MALTGRLYRCDCFDAIPPMRQNRSKRPMQRALALVLSAVACAPIAHAQDGTFDPGFGNNSGRLLIDVSSSPSDAGQVLRIQADGRLVMAGSCYGASDQFCATRLRANGSYDSGFGPGGVGYLRFDRFEPQGFPHAAFPVDMQLLGDGRMVFLGNTSDGILMAVLKPDGSALDAGVRGSGFFGFQYGATGAGGSGSVLHVQADGGILVAGGTTGPNGNYDMAITRFRPDFSVDATFGNGGYQTVAFDLGGPSGLNSDWVDSLAAQADGRILLGGSASGSPSAAAIARLLPNGQRDMSFGPDQDGRLVLGGNAIRVIRVDRAGRIVIAMEIAGSPACVINRLLADGSNDPAFNGGHAQLFTVPVGGFNGSCSIADLAVQADGTILATGSTYRDSTGHTYFMAAKLTATGALDSSFGIGGKSYGSFATSSNRSDLGAAVAVGNGGLMIAGSSTDLVGDSMFGIARLQLNKIFVDGFEN
jgi:uncharacterized delta-60 repeat protein